jgi:protein-tyrosine phosphatase
MLNNLRAAIVRDGIRRSKSFRLITGAVISGASLLTAHPLLVIAQDFTLRGVANFRDIGGYRADGGHKIKSGLIFRSGELSGLTPADRQTLAVLNIRYEFDLRTDAERSANPSNWGNKAPQIISISVGMPRDGRTLNTTVRQLTEVKNAAEAKARMQETTASLAIDGAADIGKVLSELSRSNGPALIHCTAGKDRTGVTVAVLMTLLGASREDVYHEYTRSNESIDAQLERQKAREQSGKDVNGLSGIDPAVLKTMMGTDSSYLEAMFQKINAKYGSFDAYTREGLGITSAQVAQLRKNFLEQ